MVQHHQGRDRVRSSPGVIVDDDQQLSDLAGVLAATEVTDPVVDPRIDPVPNAWLVEARVLLKHPWQASEVSRRDFFEAMHAIQGSDGRPAEVGWTGDDMAFVSVTLRAWTEQDAAESFARITKRAATAGARWRLATGLEVEILAVTPID